MLGKRQQPDIRTVLRADFHDAFVLASGLDHFPAFPNVVRSRLFDIYVLARLASPNRHQGVPMIGHGEHNRVDVLVLKQLSVVDVSLDLDVALFELRNFGIQKFGIDIAYRGHAHAGELAEVLDVFHPLLSNTHNGYANVVIGPPDLGPCAGRQRGTAGSSQ